MNFSSRRLDQNQRCFILRDKRHSGASDALRHDPRNLLCCFAAEKHKIPSTPRPNSFLLIKCAVGYSAWLLRHRRSAFRSG